jgi:hypothetical protein
VLDHEAHKKLDLVLEYLERFGHHLFTKERELMSAISDLEAQVAVTTTVEKSALTLIEGFAAQLAAAGTDAAKLATLQADLKASADALAAAVAANTPAAPPVAPVATPAAP